MTAFDFVVCRSLLPHVEAWKDAVFEMKRVCRKGVLFHHNYAGFLPARTTGAARFTATRADLEELGVTKYIPVAALVVPGKLEEIESVLEDELRYNTALAYERLTLPHLPLECASKFIALLEKRL